VTFPDSPARAEREGLVVRSPSAEPGSRAVLVSLTDAGHALIEQSVDAVLSREAALVADLTADERTALTELLARLLTEVTRRVGE
jgi:DNA-binding MarR family transcriptional regulator